MLNIYQAIFLGILQGITEWLPVSSSGHLAIAQHYLGINVPIAFDIMLHAATLLVIFILFRKEIKDIIISVVKLDFKSVPGKMFIFIIIGSIPTAAIGFTLKGYFESLFFNMDAVGMALLVTGLILLISRYGNGNRPVGYKTSIIIGIAQGFAIAPGISRSGATIGTALFSGIKREQAVRYSFLLAVPAIIGAMLFEADELIISGIGWPEIAIGFITSFVVGLLFLKIVIRLVVQKKFSWFAAYCFALGLLIILW